MKTDLEERLQHARRLYRARKYDDPVFEELADANFEPAKQLFREMLDDPDEDVRYRTLSRLHLMKGLSDDPELIEKVRTILMKDPDHLSRGYAAAILGRDSKWPDRALQHAIDHETAPVVRQTAFLGALELQVSWNFADDMRDLVRAEAVELSTKNLDKLVAEQKAKATSANQAPTAAKQRTKKKTTAARKAEKPKK